jgi:hypothetical protein
MMETAFPHSGRTDQDGGHWDHQKKEYHYHKDGQIIVDKQKNADCGKAESAAEGKDKGVRRKKDVSPAKENKEVNKNKEKKSDSNLKADKRRKQGIDKNSKKKTGDTAGKDRPRKDKGGKPDKPGKEEEQ